MLLVRSRNGSRNPAEDMDMPAEDMDMADYSIAVGLLLHALIDRSR
jgi:hypothetical protein